MAVETNTDVFGRGFLAGWFNAYKQLAGDKSKNNVNFKMIALKELRDANEMAAMRDLRAADTYRRR